MKKQTLIIIMLAVLLGASLTGNVWQYRAAVEGQPGDTTSIKVVYRTIKDTMPQAAEERPTDRVVTAKLHKPSDPDEPVKPAKADEPLDTLPELTLNPDSTVTIPITQKIYRDSLYTAYVSGYAQNLDSIFIRERITTITTRKKARRWNIGVTAGAVFGARSRQIEPGIAVGITYNFLK